MGRIGRLTEELINKIAAGEVVERPASVVKELCENSLDAGARSIRISVQGAGLQRLTIRDDGHGMSREDALLAVERHATSKLRDLPGLFNIRTMGFRGEALPSIASVSRFTLETSEAGAQVGTRVTIEGGRGPVVEETAPAGGTAIDVEDLFFNTPARRKFLKREETELKHLEEAVVRLALANPEVGFQLESEGRVLLTTSAGQTLPERVAAALGPEAHPHLLPVDERRLGLSVTGVIAAPEFTLSNQRGLYTFVNRRFIRDRGVNHAIQKAFSEGLAPGRQPVAVLFLELDPEAVDVNVHPQKLEVRFADPRGIYEAVHAAVARALSAAAPAGALAPTGSGMPAEYALAVDRFLQRAQTGEGFFPAQPPIAADHPLQSLSFGQARPGINEAPPQGFYSGLRFIGELARRYWLCEGQGGTLVVLDAHGVRERAALEQLRDAFGEDSPQETLFGQVVQVPATVRSALTLRATALARLGLRVEAFGGDALRVENLPVRAEGEDLVALLTELAESLPTGEPPEHVDAYAGGLRVLACRMATEQGTGATEEERRRLFSRLDGCDFAAPARHGTVVVHQVPLLVLEGRSRS